MRNVRVRLSYDGSRFFGWQRQEGFESVQQALEEALEALTGVHVAVHGAGRTDTGVHALAQAANFHVETRLGDERLLFALNAHLPEGVVVHELETCADDFHALRDATGKHYAYLVATSRFRPAIAPGFCHWVPGRPDVSAMRRAARYLVGEHDFSSFASAGSPRRSNVRLIHGLHVLRRREGLAVVVRGNGFLYNMVRAIAGTLLEVGRGKLVPEALPDILAARRRDRAGPTAPAHGLYLVRVLYPQAVWPRRP